MKNFLLRLLVIIVCAGGIAAAPHRCAAQAHSATDSVVTLMNRQDTTKDDTKADTIKGLGTNTIPISKDTGSIKNGPFQPIPKKAGLYSALLPGLGQLYNRQYWKIPIVYAGLGAAGYFFIDNLNNYQSFRKAYLGRINNPYPTDEYVKSYSTAQLQQLQNDYNRYMNLTVLFGSLGYALQILDAITAAHLKNFDMSRDISMRMLPVAMPQGIGMGLVIDLKPRPSIFLPRQ